MTFLNDSILCGEVANSRAALVQIALGLAGTSSDGPLTLDLTSGEQTASPQTWPTACRIGRSTERASLLVFADPYSDSTRTALDRLARILEAISEDKVPAVHILFSKPGYAERWTPDNLWAQAAALPGAIVSWDAGAYDAAVFGGRTSCTVLVYSRDGHLRFVGSLAESAEKGTLPIFMGDSACRLLFAGAFAARMEMAA